jgi:hypothetical protein
MRTSSLLIMLATILVSRQSFASEPIFPSGEAPSEVAPSLPSQYASALSEPLPSAISEPFPSDLVPEMFDGATLAPADQTFRWWDELSFFAGVDGSKQPQDYGVNANLGGQANFNMGMPLWEKYGIGLQGGVGAVSAKNAVRVYELLGESRDRDQAYFTVGAFQRMENGFSWGIVYDYLMEQSFDSFMLGQWRLRGAYNLSGFDQVGVTANIADQGDSGTFGTATQVQLQPISQTSVFWRHLWQSGTQTTFWAGVAEGHGENNIVTGPSPSRNETFLFGADLLAPLNNYFAIYGETNLITPADTGTVDAFLGIVYFPSGHAFSARRTPFAPMFATAAPTSFSVDLRQ